MKPDLSRWLGTTRPADFASAAEITHYFEPANLRTMFPGENIDPGECRAALIETLAQWTRRAQTGADMLRQIVRNMDYTDEGFNARWTLEQLVQIYSMHLASEWDIYPDEWSEEQLAAALNGVPPTFEGVA
jgi:hypothetical protein